MQSPACMTWKESLISVRFLRWVMTGGSGQNRISRTGHGTEKATFVNLQFARHVVVNEVGQLRSALDAAECAALPLATSDQLEGCMQAKQTQLSSAQLPRTRTHTGTQRHSRLVEISWPAAATPMMMDWPQPLWQASRAARMTPTFPVQSKV